MLYVAYLPPLVNTPGILKQASQKKPTFYALHLGKLAMRKSFLYLTHSPKAGIVMASKNKWHF